MMLDREETVRGIEDLIQQHKDQTGSRPYGLVCDRTVYDALCEYILSERAPNENHTPDMIVRCVRVWCVRGTPAHMVYAVDQSQAEDILRWAGRT